MDTIYCIDNSSTIRAIVKDCVEDLGFHFEEAENGAAGLAELPTIPNLKMVILDWNMPMMSGRDTLRHLRELETTKTIRIMVLIGIDQKDQVMEAIDLGATNYMLKPFRVNALQDKIEEMMNNAV